MRPGPGAPWSQPGAVVPTVVTTDDVRRAVVGRTSGSTRTHDTLPEELRPLPARPAAVLAVVFADHDGGQAQVVLTRRSARLRSHTGEVSFPGGRLDLGETAQVAALRETFEEVGIDPAMVEVIGRLSPLSTWSSPAAITPFVGLLPGPPVLRPNPAEVDRAFTVPLVELYSPDCYREELWRAADGQERPISFFEVVGDTVWGATGRMLRELLDLIWVATGPASASGGAPGNLEGS
jgi:8-oxo-dGTP pyrophosphatase MutT (NUDIX family)